MMVLGTVIVGQIANSCTPISHAMSITGMTTYTSYTGGTIDFFTFCAVLTPLAIVCLVLWFIIAQYIWKPDISSFREINFDKLAASCGKMGKREKIAGVMYIIVLILWVVPGLARYVAPVGTIRSLINQNYPPLVALFILNLVCIEGKPVLPFQGGVQEHQLEHLCVHSNHHVPGFLPLQRRCGPARLARRGLHADSGLRQPHGIHDLHSGLRHTADELHFQRRRPGDSVCHRNAAVHQRLCRGDKPHGHRHPYDGGCPVRLGNSSGDP